MPPWSRFASRRQARNRRPLRALLSTQPKVRPRSLSLVRAESSAMPAQIILVHDDAVFAEPVSCALRENGYEVMVFPDPLAAVSALETAERMDLVITRVEFPPGRSNGVALARMAHHKRPGVKLLFVCRPQFREHVEDLGELLPRPVAVAQVVDAAGRLLRAHGANQSDGDHQEPTRQSEHDLRGASCLTAPLGKAGRNHSIDETIQKTLPKLRPMLPKMSY
jgi:DNA-binding NtrC family response regulator